MTVYAEGEVVGQAQRRNPTSSTEVVGHINQSDSHSTTGGKAGEEEETRSNIVALCTLDGTYPFFGSPFLSCYPAKLFVYTASFQEW